MGPVEPGQAAEKIVVHYGSFKGTVALSELEASLGQAQSDLTATQLPIPAPAVSQLKGLLTRPLPFLSPEQTDSLFRSPSGEALLEALAEVLFIGDSPEQAAADLRTALVEAAASSDGVTGLNVLRYFPQDIHWDARRTMALWQRRKQLKQDMDDFLAQLDQDLEEQLDLSERGYGAVRQRPWEQEDLRLGGRWRYRQAELKLWDGERDRPVLARLYLPELQRNIATAAQSTRREFARREFVRQEFVRQKFSRQEFAIQGQAIAFDSAFTAVAPRDALVWPPLEPVPLLVMSHGLAADRQSRRFLAEHLASHGIAVAMVQHSGSDSEQFQGMLRGERREVAVARSFLDRPQDISFLLDELERLGQVAQGRSGSAELGLAQGGMAETQAAKAGSLGGNSVGGDRPEFHDDRQMLEHYPLQLEQVAVFGHSFGAYTALALGGAEINFAQLRQDCEAEAMLLDLSLVLQCRALALESQPLPPLKDGRIGALMLVDPMSRSIFGPEELKKVQLPVVWSGGDRDRFTPFRLSQLPSFQWLGSRDKHLAVTEATRHVYLQSPQSAQPVGQASVQTVARGQRNPLPQIVAQPGAVQDYTNALGLALVRTYLVRDRRYRAYFTAPYAQQLSQAPYHLRLWSPGETHQQPLSQMMLP